MKKVFAINMSGEIGDSFDGELFAVKTVAPELSEKNAENYRRYEQMRKAEEKPKWVLLLKFFLFMAGVVLLAGIVGGLSKDGTFVENFKQGFMNAPYIFVLCPICFILWAVLSLCTRARTFVDTESEQFKALQEETAETTSEIKNDLGIPEEVTGTDILAFPYKINKKGEQVSHTPFATHMPLDMYVYRDGDDLRIANHLKVYAFPLSEIVRVDRCEEKIKLVCWNKDAEINEDEYKDYGMSFDSNGAVNAKGYATVVLNHNGEEWGIDIPLYEIDAVCELIGRN